MLYGCRTSVPKRSFFFGFWSHGPHPLELIIDREEDLFCSLKDQGKVFFVRLNSMFDHLDFTLVLLKLALYLKECLGELIWYFVQNVNLVS